MKLIGTPEQLGKLFAALARVQGKLVDVVVSEEAKIATKSGGSYSYKYATLADYLQVIRPLLSAEGLSVMQFTTSDRGKYVGIITLIGHAEGGYIEGDEIGVTLGGDADIKALGSAVTYLRRYSLPPILGLASEDDDGTEATKTKAPPARGEPKPQPAPAPVEALGDDVAGPATIKALEGLMRAKGVAKETMEEALGFKIEQGMTKADASKAVALLTNKPS